MTGLPKFDELRLKTDKQLLQVVNNALDLGIREARHALRSCDNRAVAEDHYLRAKRAYAEASLLMGLAGEIPEEERVRWEEKLDDLQGMLEALSTIGSKRTPTGNKIPVLARALWKARGCPEGSPEDDWFRAERALKQREAHVVCVG